MRILTMLVLSFFLLALGGVLLAQHDTDQEATLPQEGEVDAVSPLSFTVADIDGKVVDLARYRGKVVMIVNVASNCGYTPQYVQLQALYAKYAAQGLEILAFPANNFGGQEPGSNEEIATFCTVNYGVKFDLFSKISVAGEDIAPLYRHLTDKTLYPQTGGPIAWNFTKFLIGRDGRVTNRFEPKVLPDQAEVVKAIETALAVPEVPVKEYGWNYTLPEALTEAKERNTLILVDFYADWCGWCTKLEQDTLSKAEVKTELRKFTLLKLDTDKYPAIARQYNVTGLPTTAVLDANGKLVQSRPGYMPPKDYLLFLGQVVK